MPLILSGARQSTARQWFKYPAEKIHMKVGDNMGRLTDAAVSGDRLQALKELRDMLSQRLEGTSSARDMSSLSLRLMKCLQEIQDVEEEQRKEASRKDNTIEQMRQRIFAQHGKMSAS